MVCELYRIKQIMEKLLILGAGQYGMVVKQIAQVAGWTEIAFLDDNSDLAIGRLDDIENLKYDSAVVAIGNANVREKLMERISKNATLIHPQAVVMGSVGEGSIVEPGAVVYGKVGRGCIIMSNVVVGHDAVVGDYCQIKYGSVIAERAIVPDKTKVDINKVWK